MSCDNWKQVDRRTARKLYVGGKDVYIVPKYEHPSTVNKEYMKKVDCEREDLKFGIFVEDFLSVYCGGHDHKCDFYVKE